MTRAIILAVVDEPDDLQIIERLLCNRYGVDYEVVCEHSADIALKRLDEWMASDRQVAVLLADQRMPGMSGTEFLMRAHTLHPHAKRLLLFERLDSAAAESRFRSMALGLIDYYAVKPGGAPDEAFHLIITGFLVEWTGTQQDTFKMLQMVAERWDPRAHEYRDLLERYSIPYEFFDVNSPAGRELLQRVERPDGPFPLLILFDGTVLANPSAHEAAAALGAPMHEPDGIYDLVIIGGGPAGLSAAVYGASEGLRTLVVEREAIGGQAGTSSRIRNYLGFPRGVSGQDLASSAFGQAMSFGANFCLMREASALSTNDGPHTITLSDGTRIESRTVVLATGVKYRRLDIPSVEALNGAGVYYGAALTEAKAMEGESVFVIGGGNSAGQAALHLAKYAAQVTLLVRGPSLASSMSDYLINEIGTRDNIDIRHHTRVVEGRGDYRLEDLVLQDTLSGETIGLPAAGLFILIGAHPHTDWLPPTLQRDQQGYILTGRDLSQAKRPSPQWTLPRLPYLLETSVPGIFAAGDVRARSVKRVASAVGEGAIAVQLVHEHLAQD